jgi:hypothetical protein
MAWACEHEHEGIRTRQSSSARDRNAPEWCVLRDMPASRRLHAYT